jgi:cobalamin synthase
MKLAVAWASHRVVRQSGGHLTGDLYGLWGEIYENIHSTVLDQE